MAEPRRAATTVSDDLRGAHFLIVEARFYEDIANALLEGAAAALEQAGATYERVGVPGALEIPPAVAIATDAASRHGRPFDGAIALGCVIRGATIHFEIVSEQSARALMDLSVARHLPIGNGIITVDNDEQAWERARRQELDKGGDAARAALAMVRLKRSVEAG